MINRLCKMVVTMVLLTSLVPVACTPSAVPSGYSKEVDPADKTTKSPETDWERLVAEARKEGKLMIYSSQSGNFIRAVGDAFKQRYGIEIEFASGRGEELVNKIQAERNAGLYLPDVFIAGGGLLLPTMKPAGLLDNLEPLLVLPEVTDPKAWIGDHLPYMDKDHTGVSMAATYMRYILRNTDFVKDGEITSYKDLLNPKWKQKIVFDDPTLSGTGNGFFTMLAVQMWGIEPTKEFMRQMVRQEPTISRDRRLQAEWVARGKYPLSLATNMETASSFLKMGSPLAYVKVTEGSNYNTGGAGLGVLVKRPHPNATKVFVNWLLSKEGHAVFIKNFGNPGARRDAPREGLATELFAEPDEKVYWQNEEFMLFGTETGKIAKDIFAALLN